MDSDERLAALLALSDGRKLSNNKDVESEQIREDKSI